jgi:uncharacterized protein (DUF1330 family)
VSFYVVIERVGVKDAQALGRYLAQVSPTIASHGGSYHVAGGSVESLEGDWQPAALVVFSFPTREQALAWWESEEYAPLKALRRSAAFDRIVLAEGV